MKRSKFRVRDGLLMLFVLAVLLTVMMWLFLSGVVNVDHRIDERTNQESWI